MKVRRLIATFFTILIPTYVSEAVKNTQIVSRMTYE
ncbi:hypothetical protein E2C01_030212 [Portunus trituberculatus]|uniref:Uncharacterized protein n=1 Tax=Portunus trituberculatus TaxID=210409 RepID=A0A5B7EWP8_PORTR|nr:hypothetical protein [Portunus trituberculatus]